MGDPGGTETRAIQMSSLLPSAYTPLLDICPILLADILLDKDMNTMSSRNF